MMYGYGAGWVWMAVMPLVWVTLLAAIVWAVLRLSQHPQGGEHGPQQRETPLEILDRRFARGEIDADAYTQARARLLEEKSGLL